MVKSEENKCMIQHFALENGEHLCNELRSGSDLGLIWKVLGLAFQNTHSYEYVFIIS